MKQQFMRRAMGVFKRLGDPYYQGTAAEVAFYLLFSVLPVVLILTAVLSFFDISPEILQTAVGTFIDSEYVEIITEYLSAGPSSEITIFFLVAALWAASKAQFSLIRITNYSYGLDSGDMSSYFKLRFRAVLTVMLLIGTIAASLIVLVFGEGILNLVQSALLNVFHIDFHISTAWLVIRWPVAFIAYMACILINYSFMARKRLKFKRVLPGAVFASVTMLFSSWLYAFYLENIAYYARLYGSLASIIALLLWFFILSYILVLGILINVSWFEPDEAEA